MPAAPSPRVRIAARILFVAYSIVLGWIVFAPADDASRVTGVVATMARVLADWGVASFDVAYATLEFGANVVLFLPFGLLLAIAAQRLGGWRIVAVGLLTSALIESVQLFPPTRYSTLSDVVANTIGTALGWAIIAGLLRIGSARSAPGLAAGRDPDPAG